jgi:heme-degrading monooxygenase HmoA
VHVSLARVSTGDQPIENATVVAEEMVRWLREIEGFEGLVLLSRPAETLGLTFWESRETAERHRQARMEFLERMTSVADVEVEDVLDYEVTFASLGALSVEDVARGGP